MGIHVAGPVRRGQWRWLIIVPLTIALSVAGLAAVAMTPPVTIADYVHRYFNPAAEETLEVAFCSRRRLPSRSR